jgi:branched-chain amino acid transport system substrate-binding protein
MRLKRAALAAVVATASGGMASAVLAQQIVIPSMDYRTGAYAPNGIPFANGQTDYYTMLNERDGGICVKPGQCTKVKVVPCEFEYNTQKGVECYEKVKAEKPVMVQPLSTGLTYQLIPKAPVDKVPIFSMGYGRTSSSDGRIFPWVFNFPATYWSQASALVKYIGDVEGGIDKLKGKKIYLVYHNSAYGKEPIRTLQALSKKHGFEYKDIAVDHPGQEQKAAWLQIRNEKPDWVLMWGWGVMNQVAVKEAASIRFPMNRFIGSWWSGSENDVAPAGDAGKGYLSATFHAAGANFPAIQDIIKHVYDKGKATDPAFKPRVGEVLYNRGVVGALWTAEAIRNAMVKHNTMNPTGEQVRDGFEELKVDAARLKALGAEGLTLEVQVSCSNHEGPGKVAVQQWDGKAWKTVSKAYYEPDRDVTGPLIKEDAEQFAKENNVKARECKS